MPMHKHKYKIWKTDVDGWVLFRCSECWEVVPYSTDFIYWMTVQGYSLPLARLRQRLCR